MKKSTLLCALIALAVILAACGNSSDKAGNGPTASPASAAPSGDQERRTVSDAKGEQSLPANPQKIAVTYFSLTELLLALEKPPVAANYFDQFVSKLEALKPYYANAGITDIGSYNEINLEQLVGLQPDLILAGGAGDDPSGNDPIYDQLKAIAPVYFLDTAKANADWKWGLRELGKALGQEEKAEQVVTGFESKLDEAKAKLSAFQDESVLFIDVQDKNFYLWGTDRMGDYYDGIGLKKPEAFDGTSQEISLEGLSALDPDHLFIHKRPDADSAPALAELGKSEVWKKIKAVNDGRVYELESSAFSPGPIGTTYGIETILASMK